MVVYLTFPVLSRVSFFRSGGPQVSAFLADIRMILNLPIGCAMTRKWGIPSLLAQRGGDPIVYRVLPVWVHECAKGR